MTERLMNEWMRWYNNPNVPMTEGEEAERDDAILEFFGFRPEFRQNEEKEDNAE